jgi:hypothetical protein
VTNFEMSLLEVDDEALIRRVARHYGLTFGSILSKDRRPRRAAVRQIVAWVLRAHGRSLPQIGSLLGRDHTTILSNVRKIEAERRKSPTLTRELDQFVERRESKMEQIPNQVSLFRSHVLGGASNRDPQLGLDAVLEAAREQVAKPWEGMKAAVVCDAIVEVTLPLNLGVDDRTPEPIPSVVVAFEGGEGDEYWCYTIAFFRAGMMAEFPGEFWKSP